MGRDVRAWPMLVWLLLVVLVAIGCVLWFMREAMRNEQMAVREKLTEAYRVQLTMMRTQVLGRWQNWRAQLDGADAAAANFARCVRSGLADSVICFDEEGRVAYPRGPRPPGTAEAKMGEDLQAQVRELFRAGATEEAVSFVIEKFSGSEPMLDAQGRLVAANAELLALETVGDRTDPRFQIIAARLRARANDYRTDAFPSAQRRFVIGELQRLVPGEEFPTFAAEDLAARVIEVDPRVGDPDFATMPLSGVWAVPSSSRRVVALLFGESLPARLQETLRETSLPPGISLSILYPGREVDLEAPPIAVTLGPELPGWRLALTFDDHSLFNAETARRLKFHVAVACAVIAAMSTLAILIARSFGRQVALARLKNDLVATVSHELKTPLTAMRALVETLLDTEKFDEKTTREYLQMVATENARLSRLIENFLSFSRLERNKFTFEFASVPPEQIVEQAVAAFGERAHQPGTVFEAKVADELPLVRADADALTTALLNLLDNAWKYSGDEKRILLGADRVGGGVTFSVEDNGVGLSKQEQGHVFDRFYQADQRVARVVGGCGLGLSIVSSIVEAHGGRVGVASEPGKGSIFTIEIPAA
jgi:signal transduction histidine kinase